MAFIQNIIDYIFKNYDLSKDIVEVVFPNKRASIHFKRQIVSQLSKTSWMPITSSVQQAMEKEMASITMEDVILLTASMSPWN